MAAVSESASSLNTRLKAKKLRVSNRRLKESRHVFRNFVFQNLVFVLTDRKSWKNAMYNVVHCAFMVLPIIYLFIMSQLRRVGKVKTLNELHVLGAELGDSNYYEAEYPSILPNWFLGNPVGLTMFTFWIVSGIDTLLLCFSGFRYLSSKLFLLDGLFWAAAIGFSIAFRLQVKITEIASLKHSMYIYTTYFSTTAFVFASLRVAVRSSLVNELGRLRIVYNDTRSGLEVKDLLKAIKVISLKFGNDVNWAHFATRCLNTAMDDECAVVGEAAHNYFPTIQAQRHRDVLESELMAFIRLVHTGEHFKATDFAARPHIKALQEYIFVLKEKKTIASLKESLKVERASLRDAEADEDIDDMILETKREAVANLQSEMRIASKRQTLGQYDIIKFSLSWFAKFPRESITTLVLLVFVASPPSISAVILGKMVSAASTGYDHYLENGEVNEEDWANLSFWVALYCGLYPVTMLVTNGSIVYWNRLQAKTLSYVQRTIMEHVARSSPAMESDRGDMFIPVFTENLMRLSSLWNSIYYGGLLPSLTLMIGIGTTFAKNFEVGMLFLGFLPLVLSFKVISNMASEVSRSYSQANAGLGSQFKNMVEVLPSIRAYGAPSYIINTFQSPLASVELRLFRLNMYTNFVQAWYTFSGQFFLIITSTCLLYTVVAGTLSIGDYFTIQGLITSMLNPLNSLGSLARGILNTAGSVQLINELLKDKREDVERTEGGNPNGKPLPDLPTDGPADIILSNVNFTYESNPRSLVLTDVSLTIKEGSYVVLCGGSGSGKTTLLSVLMQQVLLKDRFELKPRMRNLNSSTSSSASSSKNDSSGQMKNTATLKNDGSSEAESTNESEISIELNGGENSSYSGGTFFYHGVNVYSHSIGSFKARTSVVFQKSQILYDASVRDNIAFGMKCEGGDEVLDLKIRSAAEKACIASAIDILPKGYDTILSNTSNGVNLSGGQLQRICIARALCRDPKLIFLDEATSALDPVTENEIITDIVKLCRESNITVISVSHHPDTAMEADNIVVLDHGVIVEQGTYNKLLKLKNGHFRSLAEAAQSEAPV